MCIRHIDSARLYNNEAEVGKAVRESGVSRSEIFISECDACGVLQSVVSYHIASKVMHHEHGYESTLRAIDNSLERFGFGMQIKIST